MIIFICAFAGTANAQAFDSARVYPICFKATYRVAIDRMYIKSIADTVLYADGKKADSLYNMFQSGIKARFVRKMPPSKSYISISLGIEFFKKGKVTTNIGVNEQGELNIDNFLYDYSTRDLKRLDMLFPGLSKLICVD